MNVKMIGRLLGLILFGEAIFMLPALLISLFCGEMRAVSSFLFTILLTLGIAALLYFLCRKAPRGFYAKEGMISVGLVWIVMSLLGCLPFILSGAIPDFVDAFFEMVSGFTTTGASIVPNVEILPRGILYWRSFSHWVGGMGVMVFLLAVAPVFGGRDGFTMHIMRAESPGPSVGKLVPRIRSSAAILYGIYIALTAANILFLLLGGMSLFDSVCTAFGTAGTGGFGVKNDSIAGYSPYIQIVCTVFMFLFGVNFTCYFLVLRRQIKAAVSDEELRLYFGIAFCSIVAIAINIRSLYPTVSDTVRHAAFQVSSIMTTTGFSTANFDEWPTLSKTILLGLMLVGACAGSTGGGIKCARLLILVKNLARNIRGLCSPQRVQIVKVNGKSVPDKTLENTNAYLAAYVMILVVSVLILSVDGKTIVTNLSAVAACFNNIGPGLELVGPIKNYAGFSPLSKLILTADMLAGRLEIFPILVLFSPRAWRKR